MSRGISNFLANSGSQIGGEANEKLIMEFVAPFWQMFLDCSRKVIFGVCFGNL